MAYAVVALVKIDPGSDAEHRHAIMNDFVLPQVRTLPGFQKGTWLNDDAGIGTCVVVFDTEENARAALAPLTPADGPEVVSAVVHRVEFEA